MVRYVVLGGGVGGVTCAEELSRLCSTSSDQIYLVSESRILKIVTNVQAISKTTETFDLVPTDLEHYRLKSNFHVLQGTIAHIDRHRKVLVTTTGTEYPYDKLCLAMGARPKVIVDHPHVIGIRDIESVDELCARLSRARRVMVVGNGGIALELLNEIRRVPLVWTIKDAYLGNTFLDAGASQFFMPHLFTRNEPQPPRLVPSPSLGGPQHPFPPRSSPGSSTSTTPATASLPLKKALAARGAAGNEGGSSPKASGSRKRKADGSHAGGKSSGLKHGGAALGPVWRTSLIVPAKPSAEASDRDLVIETEATVQQVWSGDEYARLKKRRRTSGAAAAARAASVKSNLGGAATMGSPGSRTTSPLARELTVEDMEEEGKGQTPTFAVSTSGDSPVMPTTSTTTTASSKSDTELDDTMDWEEQPAPKPAPRVHFVPHLGRFGEGQLGLTTHEDLEPGEQPRHFPPMSFSSPPPSHLTAPHLAHSSATATSTTPKDHSPLSPSLATTPLSTPSSSPTPTPAPMMHSARPTSASSHVGTGTIYNPHVIGPLPSETESGTVDWPLYVRLSNNKVYGVDFLISATGVLPNAELARAAALALGTGGGIQVDKGMHTSDRDVFAVGDCVACDWHPRPLHWFQMRLWSQARLMGLQAARSMVRDALIERAVGVVPNVVGGAAHVGVGPLTPFSPPLVVGSPGQGHQQQPPQHAPPPQGQLQAHGQQHQPHDVVLVGQDLPLFEAGAGAAVSTQASSAPPSSAAAAGHSPSVAPANAFSPPSATTNSASASPAAHPAAHFPAGMVGMHPHHPTTVILTSGERRTLPPALDVHFDLFAHVSRFFGFKVVLLGLFNAQGLAPGSYEVLVRSTHPGEYVKLVKDRATNQLRGAMLIGETDLEEMFENLILTGADVGFLEEVVMEPDMELEAPLFADDDDDGVAGHGHVDLMMEHNVAAGGEYEAAVGRQQRSPPRTAQDVADLLAADFAAEALHSHAAAHAQHHPFGMGMGMGMGMGSNGNGGSGNDHGNAPGQGVVAGTPVGSPEVPMSLF